MFPFLRMSVSYDIHFRMDINSELIPHIAADGITEGYDLTPCRSTTVDEYQGLLIVYSGMP